MVRLAGQLVGIRSASRRRHRSPCTADQQRTLGLVAVDCAVTLVLGFPATVATGARLSVALFIHTMNPALVRRRGTDEMLPPRRIYLPVDEARLQTLHATITVLELEAALFGDSADCVAEVTDTLDAGCHTQVLDFCRVSLIDASGAVALSRRSEVLRIHMNEQAVGRSGWLAGVNDRIVGAALRALHAEPARPWTLEELARVAGTSRSAQRAHRAHRTTQMR